jgi:hypothetical protein
VSLFVFFSSLLIVAQHVSGNHVPIIKLIPLSDVWLTVHRNSVWLGKTNWMSLFVFFISLLIVAQHVSGNHVPIIKLIPLCDVWLTVHRNSVWIRKTN